ncbi:MAG: hypothetical protein JWM95_376 [Gemmatimonadetes bacterium]|nr:hypothetical protein [Gemmatimonadota bacterium]
MGQRSQAHTSSHVGSKSHIVARTAETVRPAPHEVRRPKRIARRLTTVLAPSAHIAAVRKSAVRLCCSATDSLRAALACARASSFADPESSFSKIASRRRRASVSLA